MTRAQMHPMIKKTNKKPTDKIALKRLVQWQLNSSIILDIVPCGGSVGMAALGAAEGKWEGFETIGIHCFY